jgi:hypothetical protein
MIDAVAGTVRCWVWFPILALLGSIMNASRQIAHDSATNTTGISKFCRSSYESSKTAIQTTMCYQIVTVQLIDFIGSHVVIFTGNGCQNTKEFGLN